MKTLFQTNDDWNNLILRLTLGLVILPHGAQKLLGLFGGHGFSGTMNFFTSQMGIPAVIAFLVIIGESFGALGLILGFLTRIGAVGISCIMLGAIVLVHNPNGFFMNWSGNQAGEGFEYHLLAIAISLPLILTGGGKFSVDGILAKRFFSESRIV